MLSIINEIGAYEFVGTDEKRDEYERRHVPMYEYNPLNGNATPVFDGSTWLVDKPSTVPEPR